MDDRENAHGRTTGAWKATSDWTVLTPGVAGPLLPLLESWDPIGRRIPLVPAAPARHCHTCGGVIEPDPWGFNGPIIGR
jgi:hypothetical protein